MRQRRFLAATLVLAAGAAAVGCGGTDNASPTPTAAPQTTGLVAPAMLPPLVSLGDGTRTLSPDFTLTAQSGEPLTLSALRGSPVVLTFLYSHCMTTCPLYAGWVRQALAMAGDGQAQVRVVAVTVDPERDTVQRLRAYTEEVGWPANWSFVTGDPATVKAVLDSYRIGAYRQEPSPEMKAHGMEGYEVVHRAVVLVLDRQGHVAAALRSTDWTPQDLATVVRFLL